MKRQSPLVLVPDQQRAKLIRPADLPIRKLSPADERVREKNLSLVRSARARAKVGDIRMHIGKPCKCGEERVEELVNVKPGGGFDWDVRCLNCQPND